MEQVLKEFAPYISPIITAIGVILIAWWKHDQPRQEARIKLELQKKEAELQEKSKRRNQYVSQIYGLLWQLLHDLKADRVYIVQPHPLTHREFLSISLEVDRTGTAGMKARIQHLPMEDVAKFSSELSSRDYLYYKDIANNVRDKRARALLLNAGSQSAIIRKLSTEDDGWIGNIFCEFNHTTEISPDYARGKLEVVAEQIQYILPPIQ
ncbi:MAG: hypothetical protein J6J64_00685 [Alistipes sp.]|nr:hypothetical protein [Alistipes sp.]